MKIVKALPLIIILILTAILFYKVNNNEKGGKNFDSLSKNSIGEKVPEMEIEGLKLEENSENQSVTPDIYQGKYSIINLFASWCIACVAEHPIFMNIQDKLDEDIQLIGINWRDKEQDANKWLARHGNPYDIVGFDNIGKYGISLGVRGIPETFLVDQNGIIVIHKRGNIDQSFISEVNEKIKNRK
jgi:cytochrome c biogenesis protein CcmG/thiol:disulfide interchange protein DsbE